MYLKNEVLPTFNAWVNSLDSLVDIEKAKKYAKYFIAKHIDPTKAQTRGAVYDLFEDVYEYAEMKKVIEKGQIDGAHMLRIDNLSILAKCIVWAIEHDGFDTVKYDTIDKWGMDILSVNEDPM